ncbi:Spo11/DNA topoisomerase VI subunit A [Dipodascopsis uninucleata]
MANKARIIKDDLLSDDDFEIGRIEALAKVEGLIDKLLEDLERDKIAKISLQNRKSSTSYTFDASDMKITSNKTTNPSTSVTFPGSTIANSWRFAALLNVLDVISESLTSQKIVTKRDIYYRNTWLFKSQRVVDKLVDDISRTLDVTRADLGIVAAQKGLVFGSIAINLVKSEPIFIDNKVSLIPPMEDIKSILISNVDYILVIEKEAIFRSLCTYIQHRNTEFRGILITGKGYPDVITRQFITRLVTDYPAIPLFGLFDSDPYGIDIFSVYKFGSRSLSHESENMVSSAIEYLGVSIIDYDYGWAELSAMDRKKATRMLELPWISTDAAKDLRIELQRMLFLNRKAEMNVVGNKSSGNTNTEYIMNRLLEYEIFF